MYPNIRSYFIIKKFIKYINNILIFEKTLICVFEMSIISLVYVLDNRGKTLGSPVF